MRVLRSSLPLLLPVLAACGGADGPDSAALVLGLRGVGGAPAGLDASGRTFTIDAARAYVRHIALDLPDGQRCAALDLGPGYRCDSSGSGGRDQVRAEGPFVIDLVARTSAPPLPSAPLPAGPWRRVDVRLDDGDPADGLVSAGDPLDDQTLVASGRFDHDGRSTPFDLRLRFNEDARFERPEGVVLGADGAAGLALELDVAGWFSQLSLTDCLDDGDLELRDGRLVLEDGRGSCSDVENQLKEAIKRSAQLDRRDD